MWSKRKVLVTRIWTFLKPHISFRIRVDWAEDTSLVLCPGGGRGGGSPYDGLYGEAPPYRVPFSGFRYMKG